LWTSLKQGIGGWEETQRQVEERMTLWISLIEVENLEDFQSGSWWVLGVGFHHVPHLVLSSVSEEMTWVRVVWSVNYNHQPVKNFKLSIAMGFEHEKGKGWSKKRKNHSLFCFSFSFCISDVFLFSLEKDEFASSKFYQPSFDPVKSHLALWSSCEIINQGLWSQILLLW
jgi:hypothetical protein